MLLHNGGTNPCNKYKNCYFAIMNSFVVYMSNQISSMAVTAVYVGSFLILVFQEVFQLGFQG